MTEYNHTHQRSEDDSASAGSQATIATATEKIYVENGGFGERSIDEVNIQGINDFFHNSIVCIHISPLQRLLMNIMI